MATTKPSPTTQNPEPSTGTNQPKTELADPADIDHNGKKWAQMLCPGCENWVPMWFSCESCGWDRRPDDSEATQSGGGA
jgi:hypothetical protein